MMRHHRRAIFRVITSAILPAGLAFTSGPVGPARSFDGFFLICERDLPVLCAAHVQ